MGTSEPGVQVAISALFQRLSRFEAVRPQLHCIRQGPQSLRQRLRRAFAGVGGGFELGAIGRPIEHVVDLVSHEPRGHITVNVREPDRGLRKGAVSLHAITQDQPRKQPGNQVTRLFDSAAQAPGPQDRIHQFELLAGGVRRRSSAESLEPPACIAKRSGHESPPLVTIGAQGLTLRQHILAPMPRG